MGSALLPSLRTPLPPLVLSYHPSPSPLPLPPTLLPSLLLSLRSSHHTALALDSRPGLKFLLQKVAQIPAAANLYWQVGQRDGGRRRAPSFQAAAAWSLRVTVLWDLCVERAAQEGEQRGAEYGQLQVLSHLTVHCP